MKVFKCKVEVDNGATIEDKDVIVFAENTDRVKFLVDKLLCKTCEDYVKILSAAEADFSHEDAFVVVDGLGRQC